MKKDFFSVIQNIFERYTVSFLMGSLFLTVLIASAFFFVHVYLVQRDARVGDRVLLEFREDLLEDIREEWQKRENVRQESLPPERNIFSSVEG
ncbi:MAG: hypothetical protein Q8P71_00245 [bacterium]|nr:hypothetical protein [bacterium]